MKKVYVYLTRRDKTKVKILGAFNGPDGIPMTKVDDVSTIGLPEPMRTNIRQEVKKNEMLWELWVESSESYPTLRQNLMKRGYAQVPGHYTMSYHLPVKKNAGTEQYQPLKIKAQKIKTMLRKGR